MGWLDAGEEIKRPQSAAAQARQIAGIVLCRLVLYVHIGAEQSLNRLRRYPCEITDGAAFELHKQQPRFRIVVKRFDIW
ncbi:hypothetical protein H4W29_000201 [Rhizobium viscosum]|uniref:Uncharacterized protein n=1 Tax=Rhizobium viscosum TaxID=1673 RepID=A0ABR9IIL0_RHIVS|nr:hypothetical protein [Rhizobium viscosum]